MMISLLFTILHLPILFATRFITGAMHGTITADDDIPPLLSEGGDDEHIPDSSPLSPVGHLSDHHSGPHSNPPPDPTSSIFENPNQERMNNILSQTYLFGIVPPIQRSLRSPTPLQETIEAMRSRAVPSSFLPVPGHVDDTDPGEPHRSTSPVPTVAPVPERAHVDGDLVSYNDIANALASKKPCVVMYGNRRWSFLRFNPSSNICGSVSPISCGSDIHLTRRIISVWVEESKQRIVVRTSKGGKRPNTNTEIWAVTEGSDQRRYRLKFIE